MCEIFSGLEVQTIELFMFFLLSIGAMGAHVFSRIYRDFSLYGLLIFRFFRFFGPKNSNYDMTLMELFVPWDQLKTIEALLKSFGDLDF